MTPRKRRYRMPREERPSAMPQDENPPEETIEGGQGLPASGEQAPESRATPNEPEIYYPPLKSDGLGGFSPLPARSGATRNAEPPRPSGARRRRRQNPLISRPDASELGERLESMAARVVPTFDFFLFSLLAGVVLGIGYLFDAPAILLFGVLIAPILGPWVGAALAAAIGEIRFLGQTIGGFFAALVMIFVTALIAGWISRIFMPIPATQALLHARWWPPFDLLLLAAGTVALAVAFVHSEEKPWLANLMVAYEIYLPVSAAGFGLGSGLENIWPQALLVLLVHLAISVVLALVVFYYMGFRPLETYGYALVGLIAAASLVIVFVVVVWGNNISGIQPFATPVPTVTPTVAVKPTLIATKPRPSLTPVPLTPTITLTAGPTLVPTAVYGRVANSGAYIRDEPGGAAITTLQSGYLVEILPDTPLVLEGTTWVRIRVKTATRDMVGWALLNLIVTATPAPATPAATATATATPTITETPTEGPSPTPTETLPASGSYAVVNITQYDGSLNVRSGAGVSNPLTGSLAYTTIDIGRIGSPVTIGSSEWWQVRKTGQGAVTGWVNAFYITEYVPSTTFCSDTRVTALLTNLGAALKNVDGVALAALVSPKHGLDIRLVSNNAPVNYPQATASSIFTDTTTQNWGPAGASDVRVNGTFMDIIQPKLLDVYNSSYQLSCNDASRLGRVNQPWPSEYTTINYYSIYKPSTGDAPSWRDFLVGIEYVNGQPYLFSLIYFEPGP